MPTIAIVLNTAWNIYNFRLGLIKTLQAEGYQVIAIAPRDEYAAEIEATGCHFIDLPNLKRKGMNPFYDLRLMYNLFSIYRKYKVDVALHYTIKPVIFGTLATRFLSTKAINTMTGLGYAFLSNSLIRYLVMSLYRLTLPAAYRTFFQNQDDQALFLQYGLVQKAKTAIVPGSGINTQHFQPQTDVEKRDRVQFLFIGRLLTDKGICEFADAIKIVKKTYSAAQFHVVGELDTGNRATITAEELESWQEEKLIIYHGQKNDVRPFIIDADALVLPSYREGLPRVMLEGMAMGKPLITTDVPGCRATVVHGENGYLVEVKNAEALAKAMINMIEIGQERRLAMGQKGRQMALDIFDERKIVAHYLKVINTLSNRSIASSSALSK